MTTLHDETVTRQEKESDILKVAYYLYVNSNRFQSTQDSNFRHYSTKSIITIMIISHVNKFEANSNLYRKLKVKLFGSLL